MHAGNVLKYVDASLCRDDIPVSRLEVCAVHEGVLLLRSLGRGGRARAVLSQEARCIADEFVGSEEGHIGWVAAPLGNGCCERCRGRKGQTVDIGVKLFFSS